jgi:hypothetical protein
MMNEKTDAGLIERADKMVQEQLINVRSRAAKFLECPSSDSYSTLCKSVSRLQVAINVHALVRTLGLEGATQLIVDEWKGGGGGASGGGASGSW